MAAQLLWLNLVTNGLQDLALAFEPGEPGVLRRPPRPRTEGVMSRLLWERTLITGLVMAVGTLMLFRWELDAGGSLSRARTVALTTMVLFQTFHVWNCRSTDLSAFRKSPSSNPFLFAADTFHNVEHVAHPEWDTSSDEDGETALATRRRVLGELADSGARTAITHGTGPHAFRVEHDGAGGFRAVEERP